MSDDIINEIFGIEKRDSIDTKQLIDTWTKAGKPRDLQSIKKLLMNVGIREKHVAQALQSNNISPQEGTIEPVSDMKDIIKVANEMSFDELTSLVNALTALVKQRPQ